jgi:hypothetical protein
MGDYYFHGFRGKRKMKSILKNGLRSNNLINKKCQTFRESEPNSLYVTESLKLASVYSCGNKHQKTNYKYRYVVSIPKEAINPEDMTRDYYDVQHHIYSKEADELNPSFRMESTIIPDFLVYQVFSIKPLKFLPYVEL